MKKAKSKKRASLLSLSIAAALLVCLLFAAVLGRAFLRATAVPTLVNATYRPFFEHHFDSSFTPINGILKGINAYSGIRPNTHLDKPCSVTTYEGFQESLICQRVQDTKGIIPAPAFVSDWKFGSPNLENYLLAHGWKKRDDQQITALFDNLREARWINYSKGNDNASCHLYLHYEGRPKPTTSLSGDNKFYVSESCLRWVDIGY